MEYIPITPKTFINISPRKYGWNLLMDEESIKNLPKTTIYINHSDEIRALAKMITSIAVDEFNIITTTDNKAFVDRLYRLIKDNLNLGNVPEGVDIEDIRSLQIDIVPHPNTPAINAVSFVTLYYELESMIKGQMTQAGIKFPNDRPLSKEELESPLSMDEETLSLHPIVDGKVYYLTPIALRYITYIFASIIHQFKFGE